MTFTRGAKVAVLTDLALAAVCAAATLRGWHAFVLWFTVAAVVTAWTLVSLARSWWRSRARDGGDADA